ncbi:STAS-like domain-containing protein [uncultured Methanobrevibacter sp.]|uniref:STAS-like domain-containing protein n=1 Tax=uncultured Methanobrevibacter sp. TaxID=253161 RepID=UPI00345CCFCA
MFTDINNKTEVILDFKNIEFMSRSFAQEYIFQKHTSNTKITEINMSNSIKQLLNIVSEDFEKTCL